MGSVTRTSPSGRYRPSLSSRQLWNTISSPGVSEPLYVSEELHGMSTHSPLIHNWSIHQPTL